MKIPAAGLRHHIYGSAFTAAVDRDVHITTARPIDAEYRDAILRWVIRVNGFSSGSQISQVRQVAAIERQVLDIPRSYVHTYVCLLFANEFSLARGDRHSSRDSPRIKGEAQAVRYAYQQLNVLGTGIPKTTGARLNVIATGRQQIDFVFSAVVRGSRSSQTRGFIGRRYSRTSNHGLVFIDDGSGQRSARCCLRESAAESDGYEGQKKGCSGQSFEHFSR